MTRCLNHNYKGNAMTSIVVKMLRKRRRLLALALVRLTGLALALAGFTTWTAPLCNISSRSARSVHAAALPAIEGPPKDLHLGRPASGFDHQSSQSCQYSI